MGRFLILRHYPLGRSAKSKLLETIVWFRHRNNRKERALWHPSLSTNKHNSTCKSTRNAESRDFARRVTSSSPIASPILWTTCIAPPNHRQDDLVRHA